MASDAKVHTFEEVSKHNITEDCWLIILGKIFLGLLDLVLKFGFFFLGLEQISSLAADQQELHSAQCYLWKKSKSGAGSIAAGKTTSQNQQQARKQHTVQQHQQHLHHSRSRINSSTGAADSTTVH
ncbi:unnamed protein product [Amaranthus hypochondriacus]